LFSFRADSVSDVISEHTKPGFFDELALGQLGSMRRSYAVGAGLFLAAGVVICMTRLGRGTLSTAVGDLAGMQPGWIVAAASLFAIGLLASAAGWRVGLRACEGSACFTQISARYAIGSLVNSVAPAHLGGAVRLGLLSRTLPGNDRLWRAGGIAASVAAARTGGRGRPDSGLACTLARPRRRRRRRHRHTLERQDGRPDRQPAPDFPLNRTLAA
jgi:hypothetical protein